MSDIAIKVENLILLNLIGLVREMENRRKREYEILGGQETDDGRLEFLALSLSTVSGHVSCTRGHQ